MANLVIVSNRLPVSVKRVDGKLEFYPSVGGLATGLSSYVKRRGTKWIGWPGLPNDDLIESEKRLITKELKKHRCYPIFLDAKQIAEYYNGYSNSVLWPVFHNLPLKPHTAKHWQAYRKVNAIFAEEALRLSKPGSTIWVHDYQLMLLPRLLRQAGRNDKIGFFLHIPFPKPKGFAQISEGKALLQGIVGADLAGFHTHGYTEQFLASCADLLGVKAQRGRLIVEGRTTRVTEFPMGIDYNRFAQATKSRSNRTALRKLRAQYRGQKVIVTVDRLEPAKGLVERVKAYQSLLRQNPKLVGKIKLIMIVAPSRTDVSEYKTLKDRLDAVLLAIQKEFATAKWQPVDFIYEAVPLDSVMVYYHLADVAFIAPIRDGMNLVAKEFIASKRHNDGVLVLSKTAGAAEELQDAIQVDPTKPQTMVDGLLLALTMRRRELRRRARTMKQYIEKASVQKWADNFMDVLQQPLTQAQRLTRSIDRVQESAIASAYRASGKRLLLLDYDGVLRRFVHDPTHATPSPTIMKILKKISNDPRNELVIVSGRSKADLQQWFGQLPIALAADHGALFRRKGGKNWHKTSASGSDWKKEVGDVFNYYAGFVPGALVEQKDWAFVWHYRSASPYYAQKYLVALKRLLKPIAKKYNLSVTDGNKILEVHPADINKGRISQEWLIHDHDFIMAIGDDVTDEDMFAALPPEAYTIKVGRGLTKAHYRLKDVSEVVKLLERL